MGVEQTAHCSANFLVDDDLKSRENESMCRNRAGLIKDHIDSAPFQLLRSYNPKRCSKDQAQKLKISESSKIATKEYSLAINIFSANMMHVRLVARDWRGRCSPHRVSPN